MSVNYHSPRITLKCHRSQVYYQSAWVCTLVMGAVYLQPDQDKSLPGNTKIHPRE